MDIISGQKAYPKNYYCNNLTRNDLKISFRKTWKHFKKIFEIVDKETISFVVSVSRSSANSLFE